MEYISSKNICLLIRETLKLLDKRPMQTGARTSYIVYKMLAKTELFEEFEMAELCSIAMLRDIGAYKTDKIDNLMRPGFRKTLPHSVYGYLFMKHLFPVPAYGKILLYHHMDYEQMSGVSYEFDFMSDYIHLADDLNMQLMRNPEFDYHILEKDAGVKYEEKTFQLFKAAEEEYGVLQHLKKGDWKEDLLGLMDYIMFRNDEKIQYLQMLMYCIGFKGEEYVVDTVAAMCIAQEIGRRLRLNEENLKLLYYGAMLHDIGMLGLVNDNITYPLNEESIEMIRQHIDTEETILRRRFTSLQVVDIAVRHHERLDGSGYPRGLKEADMTLNDMILQTADLAADLMSKRGKRVPKGRKEICALLQKEGREGRLKRETVEVFLKHFDEIVKRVQRESDLILATYRKLEIQFEKASVKLQALLK